MKPSNHRFTLETKYDALLLCCDGKPLPGQLKVSLENSPDNPLVATIQFYVNTDKTSNTGIKLRD